MDRTWTTDRSPFHLAPAGRRAPAVTISESLGGMAGRAHSPGRQRSELASSDDRRDRPSRARPTARRAWASLTLAWGCPAWNRLVTPPVATGPGQPPPPGNRPAATIRRPLLVSSRKVSSSRLGRRAKRRLWRARLDHVRLACRASPGATRRWTGRRGSSPPRVALPGDAPGGRAPRPRRPRSLAANDRADHVVKTALLTGRDASGPAPT